MQLGTRKKITYIIIWQVSLPVKWRAVIGGEALHYAKTNACILKQNSKTIIENLKIKICY
jgi:hypothetical protein